MDFGSKSDAERQEVKKKHVKYALLFQARLLQVLFATHSLRTMSKDTQDNGMPFYYKAILAILRMADDRMLHESGNPVYLRLKDDSKELDLIR